MEKDSLHNTQKQHSELQEMLVAKLEQETTYARSTLFCMP